MMMIVIIVGCSGSSSGDGGVKEDTRSFERGAGGEGG